MHVVQVFSVQFYVPCSVLVNTPGQSDVQRWHLASVCSGHCTGINLPPLYPQLCGSDQQLLSTFRQHLWMAEHGEADKQDRLMSVIQNGISGRIHLRSLYMRWWWEQPQRWSGKILNRSLLKYWLREHLPAWEHSLGVWNILEKCSWVPELLRPSDTPLISTNPRNCNSNLSSGKMKRT